MNIVMYKCTMSRPTKDKIRKCQWLWYSPHPVKFNILTAHTLGSIIQIIIIIIQHGNKSIRFAICLTAQLFALTMLQRLWDTLRGR